MAEVTVAQILDTLGPAAVWVSGPGTGTVSRPVPIGAPTDGGLSFCTAEAEDALPAIAGSRAKVILCRSEVDRTAIAADDRTVIGVDNPRRHFIRLLSALLAAPVPQGNHPTAVIHPSAKLGAGTTVGPLAYVGACEIGAETVIHGRAYVADGSVIGCNVVVHPGAVIGADGYGFERNEDGTLERFPHFGNVVIEDDVEIGANSCIDRGTLGDTVIGQGTKVDNLVHIAHNVKIGRHSVITASSIIAGSADIGDCSWIAPGSAINNKISVGSRTTVGIGSVVVRDIPDGVFVAGVPARKVPGQES